MTFKELLTKSAELGEFPRVFYPEHGPGTITVLKNNRSYKGCGVQFDSLNYDKWFWDSDEADKRTKYMRDLTFLETDQ